MNLNQITNQLDELESASSSLDPNQPNREQLTKAVTEYAAQFLSDLPQLKAFDQSEDEGRPVSEIPIPGFGRKIEDVLAEIRQFVDTPGINPASAGHLGYIPGGGLYFTALADYLAAVTNRYAGVYFASPGAVRIEQKVVRWMNDFVGFPDSAGGDLTSGGSIANLTAIHTARKAHQIKARDYHRSVVYLSDQTHHCVKKALNIAGMEEAILRFIDLDDRFRINPIVLQKQINADKETGLLPWMIVGSAGTTDTGSIDPLNELADIAAKEKLWFHVDGAYGAAFALCDSGKDRLVGLERADSVVLDPHKGFFLSYGSGAVLVRNAMHLHEAHQYHADYMQDAVGKEAIWSPAEYSVELSRPFRGLRMWLALQLAGENAFKAALEEKLLLAEYFHQKIQQIDGFEVSGSPQLSVVIFRFRPQTGDVESFNQKLVNAIQQDGTFFLSSTLVGGEFAIRMAALVFRTHRKHIDQLIEILIAQVKMLLLQAKPEERT